MPLQLATHYRAAGPRDHVGGDWLDVVDARSGSFLIVGDVEGHGERAATLMRPLRAVARLGAAGTERPAELLRAMNDYLADTGEERMATALVLHIDAESSVLTIASAGHLPAVVVRPGAVPQDVDVEPGPPLGIGTRWPETRCGLDPETVLLLYTDGLVEARGWPIDHGLDLLKKALSGLPTDIDLSAVLDAALAIIPAGSRDDDVAVLVASSSV